MFFFFGIPVLKIDPDCSYVSVSFFELFFVGSVLGCHCDQTGVPSPF